MMWEASEKDLFAGAAAPRPAGPRDVTGELTADDLDQDRTLRPRTLDEYIGQERVRENLRVLIQAARDRGEALDHVIFSGPPGLGKTTLAGIVANEMGAKMHTTSGPAIERAGDLAAILTNLEAGDVLFVDEIHRLNHQIEEILYPAMEDFFLDIVIGKGPAARSIRIDVPHFTLVGATTRTGLLTGPLRDRFGISYRLDYYTPAELGVIVSRSAHILGVEIDEQGAAEIASRSRGTPRLANRLLKRCARLRAGQARGHDHLGGGRRGARVLRDRRHGPRHHGRAHPHRALQHLPRPPGGAHHGGRAPSPRTPPRSRTSTSRTCCSAGSSCARRRAARPRSPPSTTWESSRRRASVSCVPAA